MIKIEQLVKCYGDFRLDVSMEVPDGRVTGLIGKNGAGKSTVIKAILGLIRPDDGRVKVMGVESSDMSPVVRTRLGVALSDSGFYSGLSVSDIGKILKKSYRDFDEQWFLAACRDQGLPVNKVIKTFSTGMKAKLRVLTALSHDADLLILDEPTAGLDVEARNEILDILRDYLARNERRSMLITSHIATDLEGICDDIYLIHQGRIILHEDTDIILSDYGVIKADEETYEKLDRQYLITTRKEGTMYKCLTKEKTFYAENYPGLIVEKGGIDDLITMMTGR
ncbi:ABC transporter ATP-binding protein [Clostridiales Family XIII bacterium RF-744-FAT-WT-3]|uniref:ABC transporter ATP-binding protein n=1 Tax=Baileyella intestinalis TaxID=2606709 RepID=A0A6A8M5F3_9FIRM|nr:ABC transporter ATP-binding protein [Baileyella intestinalis]MST68151.1 ABC transporter ATP-binding protein [Baileyella intestinalis]